MKYKNSEIKSIMIKSLGIGGMVNEHFNFVSSTEKASADQHIS